MKVLLYTEGQKTIGKSGLGKAIKHQMKALENENIEYTLNPKDDYDILHINTYFPKSYFFAKKAKKQGKKIVYHAHSTEEDYKDGFIFAKQTSKLFKKWLIKCYSLGDVIVTPTPYSKKLLEGYGIDREIFDISNGIEIDFFKKDPKLGQKFRKKYGYKKNDKVIIGIGLYIERKGIVDFVELAKRMPEYKFIWFGYSPLSVATKPVKKAVKTKLDNLTFAGYVEQEMILCAMNGCDLYLFPTLEETEGIPIIEACACKTNAIIRDIKIFEGWLEDGKNVYKAKDVDEFEEKIKKFFNGELKSVAEASYEIAKERDIKVVGKKLRSVYEKVLKTNSKPKTKNSKKKTTNKSEKLKNLGIYLSAIILIISMFFAGNKFEFKKQEYTKSITIDDKTYQISLYTNTKNKADNAFNEIEEIINEYYTLTESESGKSELSFIYNNDSNASTLTLSDKLYKLLKTLDDYYVKSNKNLDLYTGNVKNVWDNAKANNTIPTLDELTTANNDQKIIEFIDELKIKNNHTLINLDSIIDGYILNEIEIYLQEKNIDSYMIMVDGTILTGDYYEKDGEYRIGISSPIKDNDQILQVLSVKNKAISTKGIYQNSYTYQNVDYSNIISPFTLMLINNKTSVTVVAPNALEAEILATELFIMDIDKGLELVNNNKDYEALWCFMTEDNQNKCIRSKGFDNFN